MLIDTHCHLDFKQFDQDRDQVIKRAFSQGIDQIINVGSDMRSSQACVELVKQYENIYGSVGVHPHHASEISKEDIKFIGKLAEPEKIVAIGEVGLDYFDRESPGGVIDKALRKTQKEVLIRFIEIARTRQMPLILHCRNAAFDLLPIISDMLDDNDRAVVHCFSQSKDVLKDCLNKGLYVSFTGNITYKNAGDLRELVKYCPLDRMFLETDAPYLTPQQKRGTRNEPAYVNYVAEAAADIKGMSVQRLADATTENAKKFFKIKN